MSHLPGEFHKMKSFFNGPYCNGEIPICFIVFSDV